MLKPFCLYASISRRIANESCHVRSTPARRSRQDQNAGIIRSERHGEGSESWPDRMMLVWPDHHIKHSRTTSLQVSRPVPPIRSGPSDRQGGYSLASRNLASDRHRNSWHVGTQCGIEKEQVLCAPEEDGGAMLASHGLIRFESSKNGLIYPRWSDTKPLAFLKHGCPRRGRHRRTCCLAMAQTGLTLTRMAQARLKHIEPLHTRQSTKECSCF